MTYFLFQAFLTKDYSYGKFQSYFNNLALKWGNMKMSKVIDAIFENGVFKPLGKVEIKEHERLQIIIKEKEAESVAMATSGIIPARDSKTIDSIALEPEFLPEEA